MKDKEENSTGDIVSEVIETGVDIVSGTVDIIGDVITAILD